MIFIYYFTYQIDTFLRKLLRLDQKNKIWPFRIFDIFLGDFFTYYSFYRLILDSNISENAHFSLRNIIS